MMLFMVGSEIRRYIKPPGMVLKPGKSWDILFYIFYISTGDRRISEPPTVGDKLINPKAGVYLPITSRIPF